jgi:hypothetical protein
MYEDENNDVLFRVGEWLMALGAVLVVVALFAVGAI